MASQTTAPPGAGAVGDKASAKAALKDAKAAHKAQKAAIKAAKKGEGGGKKKLFIIIGVVLVLAVVLFVLKGKMASGEPVAPTPGVVVQLDPIYVNLTDGHYLKLGLALQATAAAPKELEGAKALDAAIEIFSGKSMDEVGSPQERSKLKTELVSKVTEEYEGEVMDVYFTEFVMQ